MNPISNPNAAVVWQGTSIGALLAWGITALGVAIPPAAIAALTGAVAVTMVYAGRRGLRSIPGRLWHGEKYDEEPTTKTPRRRTSRKER